MCKWTKGQVKILTVMCKHIPVQILSLQHMSDTCECKINKNENKRVGADTSGEIDHKSSVIVFFFGE